MSPYLAQLRDFFGRLAPRQRATLAAVVAGGVALLMAVGYWASRPDYALLFGGLDAQNAAAIVERLQGDGVTYDLRDGGTAVFVPRDEVYELRLQFAAEGLVSDGIAGYELFDEGTLGMTDFMQKVSYKRALEGELARTVMNVQGITGARVHLVLPERNPFRDRQVSASASVVLHLGTGAPGRDQVDAIAALVGGAVEGLSPSNVTVVDDQGTLLSNPSDSADGSLSSSQLQHQQAVEEHLAEQGQSMLDRVLGPGRAIVRVAANLDFSTTVTDVQRIDPESSTILSEERMDEEGPGGGAASTVRNYEMTREREQREQGAGQIQFLTVSVILDHRPLPPPTGAAGADVEDAPVSEPVPYTPAQLAEVDDLVRNAVGFSEERGDRITVHQTRFDTSGDDAFAAEWAAQRKDERLRLYLRYGLMALALGVGAWLLRAATARVGALADEPDPDEPAALPPVETPQLAAGDGAAGEPALALAEASGGEAVLSDMYTSRLSDEARAQLNARRQFYEKIQKRVTDNPDEAAALIGTWLVEDRSG
ncbi:flagellar basal-body MS-ring/collar protein FliF [Rubrivirga sp. S365]|uniref:Flagellar M-ring protein n=1 Tax=Rubrivirga litoralis TaxID=3075598 RepID=A0ABU3BT00_9BACT|nr:MULTISPECIES: flagellar basal-body MS-ring/collar protein FliF [unclassified Rubrivirga]MDT0632360.1 flagellar basal-body MS-ring/collar protein FliF [Rubrivirga sp. F394]MDT7857326.1 flagellar basal-body MS-ring/collar protein FliF [Rubrivirga sp. S365]